MPIQRYRRKAQYYETDQMGIIHHANYIRWFEEARLDWLEQIDLSFSRFEEAGIFVPVVGVSVSYKSSVRFGEEVLIEIGMPEFTGAKMIVSYQITDAATGQLRTVGESTHCFINASGRPVSLKKAGPSFYEAMLKYAG